MYIRYAMYLVLVVGMVGCASTTMEKRLQSGFSDLEVGKYKEAERMAKKVLNDYENNHAAQLLFAQAAYGKGDIKKAVEIITRLEKMCNKEYCNNERDHITALLLLVQLTNNEDVMKTAQEKIDILKRKVSVQQYESMVDFYIAQGKVIDAAEAFDKLADASGSKLSQERKLQGFILYDAIFDEEKKNMIYRELTPKQRELVRNLYTENQ